MLACRKCMTNTWRWSVMMSATFRWFRKKCVCLCVLSHTHTPLCFTSDKQLCQKQLIHLGKWYHSFNFSVTLRFFKIKSWKRGNK